MSAQIGLFGETSGTWEKSLPGFRYQSGFLSPQEEQALVAALGTLELKPFEFHGHLGNRRVTSFGLKYDFGRRALEAADAFPSFLADLRNKAATFAGRQ